VIFRGDEVREVFRSLWKFGLHPLIHTFYFDGRNTKCWDKVNGAKVWIKVCNLKFQ